MSQHAWADQLHEIIQRARSSFHKMLVNRESPYERFGEDWACADGTVEWAQAALVPAGRDAIWAAEVAYSYRVNGEYYAGFYHIQAANKAEAEAASQGWKGRKVHVRYSPQDCAVSIMQP